MTAAAAKPVHSAAVDAVLAELGDVPVITEATVVRRRCT